MSLETAQSAPRQFTGWHMLVCMVTFFGVIITVNFTMAFLATGSWTGLVVKNSYVASQKFNDQLVQAKLQNSQGIRSTVSLENGIFSAGLFEAEETNLKVKNAELWIGRPVSEHLDHTINLTCGPDAVCHSPLLLSAGHWSLRLTATLNGHPYRRDMRVYVGPQGDVRVE